MNNTNICTFYINFISIYIHLCTFINNFYSIIQYMTNKLERLPLELTNLVYEFANNEKNNFYYCIKELKELNYAHFIQHSILNKSLHFMQYVIKKIQTNMYKQKYQNYLKEYISL